MGRGSSNHQFNVDIHLQSEERGGGDFPSFARFDSCYIYIVVTPPEEDWSIAGLGYGRGMPVPLFPSETTIP